MQRIPAARERRSGNESTTSIHVPGAPYDDVVVPLLESARSVLPPGTRWTDAHTHTGFSDPDGVTASAQELLAGLDRAGSERAVVFTTAEPAGYPPANDRVLAEAAASGGRLVPFCRVDPNAPDPLGEARRCFAAGARGIKLHPRSDDFALPHPQVEALVVFAAEHGAPVLFHAGRGIPALGEEVTRLASHLDQFQDIMNDKESPGRKLEFLTQEMGREANTIGSKAPTSSSGRFAALNLVRCAREVGHGPEALQAMAGAQVERLLAGEEPLDVGPAPGLRAAGHRWLAGERIVSYTSAALQTAFRGFDPTEALALARLACQVPTGGADGDEATLLVTCDELLARAQEALAADPEHPRRISYAALSAHVLAGTPRVPV